MATNVVSLPRKRGPRRVRQTANQGPAKVANFFEHKHRDTVAVLRVTLRKALRGEVSGIALCLLGTDDGHYFTDEFREGTAEAYRCAQRLAWKMNLQADELEGDE